MVKGEYTDGYIPIPIATIEGALVSLITRGARVCSKCGGIEARVTGQRMVRAPVFFCEDMNGSLNLEKWILKNL